MTKKTKEELALEAYLAGLNDKKLKTSDNRLIATNNRSEDWHKKTAERNRKNATNEEINKKIKNKNKGKRYTFLTAESIEKLAKKAWQPIVTPEDIFPCKKHADEYYFNNKLTNCNTFGSVQAWVTRSLKNLPNQFYYISREEYIKLTGKDPF